MPDKKPIDYRALKGHVFDHDKLQSQYGGERFSTRGSKHLKDTFNSAWEEYSKANPNAKKENFRNIYTTDVKDDNEITPWQVKAREAAVEADRLATEDEKSFRATQQENFSSLDPEQKQIRGKKALQALSQIKSPMTDDIKSIMKQVGAGPGVQRNRDLTDEEFGKVQKWLETRSNTGFEDDANSILQNLYANNPSPLKNRGIARQLNIPQGPNYVQMSERIGKSVNDAQEERFRAEQRAAEEERRARMDEMQQLQLAASKQAQYESLNVPADTNIPSADQYLQGASRALVNEQASLVEALKNNDIDTDEFASKSALIKSQVPALKATKEALTAFQGGYTELLQNGQLSAANTDQPGQLYNAIQTGDMAIEAGEDGQMYIRGLQNEDGSYELDMPLSQVNRLPKPIAKAQPMNLMVKDAAAALANSPAFGKEQGDSIRGVLDGLLTSGDNLQNEKTLKAIAVDSMGLTLDEATKMLNNTFPEADENGNTNQLEAAIEGAMVQEAETQWKANELKRRQAQADVAYKEALAFKAKQAATSGNPSETAAQKNYADKLVRANTALGSAANYNDPAWWGEQGLNAVPSSQLTSEQRKKVGGKDGVAIPYAKGKTLFIPSDMDPSQARAIIARQIYGVDPNELEADPFSYDAGQASAGIDTNVLGTPAPTPFKRLANWANKLINR